MRPDGRQPTEIRPITIEPDANPPHGLVFNLGGQEQVNDNDQRAWQSGPVWQGEPDVAANVYEQYVWSPRYVDAAILRDENTDADGLCDAGDPDELDGDITIDQGTDTAERPIETPVLAESSKATGGFRFGLDEARLEIGFFPDSDSKTDTCAFEFRIAVQAFEGLENLMHVLCIKADTVIFDAQGVRFVFP